MKKYLYLAMLLLAGINLTQAQRMVRHQKGMEVNAGTLSDDKPGSNYYINIGLTVNGKNGNYQIWALEYTHQYYIYNELKIPQECYTAEGGYSFYLFGDAGKNISINAGLTVVAGYESINRGEQMLYDGAMIINEDNFIYGAGGRLSLETYISDRFVLLIQGRAKVLWETSLEQLRPSAGIGLRYNF